MAGAGEEESVWRKVDVGALCLPLQNVLFFTFILFLLIFISFHNFVLNLSLPFYFSSQSIFFFTLEHPLFSNSIR
jgi:hypothetical protein